MPAANYEIMIECGATFRLALTWHAPDGTPINLTGWSARMQIRHRRTDAIPLVSLMSPSGGIVLGGTAGTINITITADDTADLTAKSGVYDLELVSPAGEVTRLVQGPVAISPEVTR